MISITSVGVYYLQRLVGTFHYLDLILQDTPIYDDKYFDEITTLFPDSDQYGNRNLEMRKKCTEKFVEYLCKEEFKDKKFVENFDDQIIMFDVAKHMKKKLDPDMKRLTGIIAKS